jgi:PST family polysaccharide transporter
MVSGLSAGICCAAAAPLLVSFYHEPRLLWGARVAALVFPCAAIAVQPLALMRRALRLKNVFFVEAGSLLAGGLVGIVLAVEWRDYRALIVQGVVTQAIRAVASLWKSGYRPSRPRKIRASLGHLGDGAWMQAFQVFTQVFRSFDNVLIGSRYGAYELGLYARAYYLTTIPSQFTVGTLNESVVPKLSRAWNSSGDFAGTYRRNLKAAGAVSIPLAVILACCAPEMIHLLYGPKWSGVNRLLAVMSLTTALQPLYNSSYWLLMSTGKFRLMAAIGGINCSALLAAFLVGIRGGAMGVAEAYGSVMVALTITTMAWTHRSVGLSLSATLATLKWPAVTSFLLTAILLAIRYLDGRLALNPISALALLCTAALLTCMTCVVLPIVLGLIVRGKQLRKITIHDIIPEVRRFLGDERFVHRGTVD